MAAAANNTTTFVIKVSIHCDGCARDIKKNVEKMEGVDTVKVDAEKQTAVITGTLQPDKVIAMLHKKLRKKAELLPNKSLKPPAPSSSQVVVPKARNRGKGSSSHQVVVGESSSSANNLLGDPNKVAQAVGELRRMIPGLTGVKISNQVVTNAIEFRFNST